MLFRKNLLLLEIVEDFVQRWKQLGLRSASARDGVGCTWNRPELVDSQHSAQLFVRAMAGRKSFLA